LPPSCDTEYSGRNAPPWKWMTRSIGASLRVLAGTNTSTDFPSGPSNERRTPASSRGSIRSCARVCSTIGDGFCDAAGGTWAVAAGRSSAENASEKRTASGEGSENRARRAGFCGAHTLVLNSPPPPNTVPCPRDLMTTNRRANRLAPVARSRRQPVCRTTAVVFPSRCTGSRRTIGCFSS